MEGTTAICIVSLVTLPLWVPLLPLRLMDASLPAVLLQAVLRRMNFKVELAYRFLNQGSPNTAVIGCNSIGCSNTGGPSAFYTLKELTSQDFKLGVRWMLQPEAPQQPIYSPPPPLMRRG